MIFDEKYKWFIVLYTIEPETHKLSIQTAVGYEAPPNITDASIVINHFLEETTITEDVFMAQMTDDDVKSIFLGGGENEKE